MQAEDVVRLKELLKEEWCRRDFSGGGLEIRLLTSTLGSVRGRSTGRRLVYGQASKVD